MRKFGLEKNRYLQYKFNFNIQIVRKLKLGFNTDQEKKGNVQIPS